MKVGAPKSAWCDGAAVFRFFFTLSPQREQNVGASRFTIPRHSAPISAREGHNATFSVFVIRNQKTERIFCKRSHLRARSTHARGIFPSDSDSDRRLPCRFARSRQSPPCPSSMFLDVLCAGCIPPGSTKFHATCLRGHCVGVDCLGRQRTPSVRAGISGTCNAIRPPGRRRRRTLRIGGGGGGAAVMAAERSGVYIVCPCRRSVPSRYVLWLLSVGQKRPRGKDMATTDVEQTGQYGDTGRSGRSGSYIYFEQST